MTDGEFQLERELADTRYRLAIERDKVKFIEDKLIALQHKLNRKEEILEYTKTMLSESLEREKIGNKIISDMRRKLCKNNS